MACCRSRSKLKANVSYFFMILFSLLRCIADNGGRTEQEFLHLIIHFEQGSCNVGADAYCDHGIHERRRIQGRRVCIDVQIYGNFVTGHLCTQPRQLCECNQTGSNFNSHRFALEMKIQSDFMYMQAWLSQRITLVRER